MHATLLALVLCGTTPPADPYANLDFRSGTLAGWEGTGFAVARPAGKPVAKDIQVTSQETGGQGKKALLHRMLYIPPWARALRFQAAAERAKGCWADDRLDVTLLAAGGRVIPRKVATVDGWQPAPHLLPPYQGQPRDYLWSVAEYAGQAVRIVLVDKDGRPGCYVRCGGFQLLTVDESEGQDFSRFMVRLTHEHGLAPMSRYDTPHFLALSNADDDFTEARLRNCELLYRRFFAHFRHKGFAVREPNAKCLVALFDSQAGFEAYLGQKMSPLIRGIYHQGSNRFVMYDYGQNEAYRAARRQVEQRSRYLRSAIERQRFLQSFNRYANDYKAAANVTTLMHELAHQLSFNSGLLNRAGDVPPWLAEGLACYCEGTVDGSWQGIGAVSSARVRDLAPLLHDPEQRIALRELVTSDHWLGGTVKPARLLALYAQSWALFRLLMQERPQALRTYLQRVYPRTIPDRRWADFEQAFGPNLPRLERRYQEYLQELATSTAPPKR